MKQRNRLDHYRLEVDVRNGPGMQPIVDALAAALERMGYTEDDYYVGVHGPPELRAGVVTK